MEQLLYKDSNPSDKIFSDILIVHGRMIMGGVEKALLSLLDALEDRNVSVTLLLLKEGGELYDHIPSWVNVEILDGYQQYEYLVLEDPLTVAKKYIGAGNFIEAFRSFWRAVQIRTSKKERWYLNYEALLDKMPAVYKAKVAISFRGLDYFVPYYVLEKTEADNKLVWIHGDVKHHIFENNVIAGKLFPQYDRIYGVSGDVKASFDEMFPALREKSSVFRNLVPEQKIKTMATETSPFEDNFSGFRLLTVGRLSALKGQDRIPVVAKRLAALNIPFRWYLVGEGEHRPELENLISEHEVGNYVKLLGNQMNPYSFLKHCDLYVQTSHTEGCSVVMHEAKIFEKPIVTTDVASAHVLISNHEDGVIMPNNEEGLFEGIKEMLLSPEKLKQFGKFVLKDEQDGSRAVDELVKLIKDS